jgi:hypothetical protein
MLDENQTPKTCLAAVKKHGLALEHVRVQTPEICLEAVRENYNALKFVLRQHGCALEYVKKQTRKICVESFTQDRYAQCYVLDNEAKLAIAKPNAILQIYWSHSSKPVHSTIEFRNNSRSGLANGTRIHGKASPLG